MVSYAYSECARWPKLLFCVSKKWNSFVRPLSLTTSLFSVCKLKTRGVKFYFRQFCSEAEIQVSRPAVGWLRKQAARCDDGIQSAENCDNAENRRTQGTQRTGRTKRTMKTQRTWRKGETWKRGEQENLIEYHNIHSTHTCMHIYIVSIFRDIYTN